MENSTTLKSAQRYMSIKEAANFWGVSQTFIRDQIASGRLPVHRLGRVIRLSRPDVENLLAKVA